jgi:hypothetical protein
MATFAMHVPRRWQEQPTGPVEINPYWRSRGLTCLYLLRAGEWFFDHVTRSKLGLSEGTGAILRGDCVETTGNTTNYHRLPLGFTIHNGGTIVTMQRIVSGVVAWSCLNESTSNWHGMYSDVTSGVKTVENNVFNGDISVTAATRGRFSVNAVALVGSNNLRGSFNGGGIVTDTSFTTPITSNSIMTLGLSRKTILDNPSVSLVQLVAAATAAWSDGELQAISTAPYGELIRRRPLRLIFDATVAGGGGGGSSLIGSGLIGGGMVGGRLVA